MKQHVTIVFCFFIGALIGATTAAEATENAKDAEDDKGSFLVLPIVITEPDIGEGLGMGLIYFHGEKEDETEGGVDKKSRRVSTAGSMGKTGKEKQPPPTATGIFGFYTNNDTHGYGIGHSASIKDDKFRLMGALARLNVNATIYLSEIPLDFELDGNVVYGSLRRRIGSSDFFLGGAFSALDADINFKLRPRNNMPEGVSDFSMKSVGIAASAMYDARDDSMMPSSGQLVDFIAWRYDEAIGSDFDYWSYRLKAHSFHQLHDRFVLGLRFDVSTTDGAPPFYAVPFVSMRGIPALRYQGDTAGVFEVEGRYTFAERWAAVAFAGAGFTDADEVLETSDDINSYGVGIRFKALRRENVWLGFDIAKGPEEYAWYIQLGHPW